MAELLTIISIISFVVAVIAFGFAVFFWFKFNIPSVVGDLSGHTARKSIAKMRENNESANKAKSANKTKNKEIRRLETENETTLLANDVDETTLLTGNNNETTLLVYDDNETTLLVADNTKNGGGIGNRGIVMLEEIMFIHTSEVIV